MHLTCSRVDLLQCTALLAKDAGINTPATLHAIPGKGLRLYCGVLDLLLTSVRVEREGAVSVDPRQLTAYLRRLVAFTILDIDASKGRLHLRGGETVVGMDARDVDAGDVIVALAPGDFTEISTIPQWRPAVRAASAWPVNGAWPNLWFLLAGTTAVRSVSTDGHGLHLLVFDNADGGVEDAAKEDGAVQLLTADLELLNAVGQVVGDAPITFQRRAAIVAATWQTPKGFSGTLRLGAPAVTRYDVVDFSTVLADPGSAVTVGTVDASALRAALTRCALARNVDLSMTPTVINLHAFSRDGDPVVDVPVPWEHSPGRRDTSGPWRYAPGLLLATLAPAEGLVTLAITPLSAASCCTFTWGDGVGDVGKNRAVLMGMRVV